MSSATAVEAAGPPRKGGKKKLIVLVAAATLVLGGAGGAALWWVKKSQAAAAAEAEEDVSAEAAPPAHPKRDPKVVPVFSPLDAFTVNLADRDADRYAQVGITLELSDAKVADQVKVFMPAIRNNILMVLAHKTSTELLEREGKDRLAREVLRETVRAMGIEPPPEEAIAAPGGDAPPPKRRKKADEPLPVVAVHFSNFIIQ